MEIIKINLPEYQVDTEPDHKAVGKIVDDVIRQYFMGRTIVARALTSDKHLNKTVDELIDVIQRTGTDRYSPDIPGDRYDNIQGKHIDLFGFRRKVVSRMKLFQDISWGFYHGSKSIHGRPDRINVVTIYDAKRLRAVVHQYEGRDDIKRDDFVFKDPVNKQKAVLGVIRINW